MRKLYCYLKTFWKEEVKLPYLLVIMGFLTLSIFIEYNYNFTSSLMSQYKRTINYFYANILFYSLPVLFSILAYIYFYNRRDLLRNSSFWFVLIYIVGAYAFRSYFYQHRDWITEMNDGVFDRFLVKCANQATQAVLVFLLVYIFWKYSGHKRKTIFYGFKLKGFDTRPYFVMLLIMLPLIALASTQIDFLNRYPTFAGFIRENTESSNLALKMGIYELLYGSDYIATELFFRGFMIYALSKYMAKGAIIPMATMYVFIHFGKPAGETISSFFGGMILGVIAYETNSIVGGIIVHCGIAYMMEIGGFIGNLYIK